MLQLKNMTAQKKTAVIFSAVLSAAGFFIYLLIFSLSRFLTVYNAMMDSQFKDSGLSVNAAVTSVIFSYLLWAVYSRLFAVYNTGVRECWLSEHAGPMKSGSIFTAMLRSPEFLVGLLTVFLLSLLPWGVKDSVVTAVHYGETVSYSAHRTEEFFEYVPFYLIVHTLFSFTSRKTWMKKRSGYPQGKAGMKNDLKQFFKFFAIYTAILLACAGIFSDVAIFAAVIFLPLLLILSLLLCALSLFPAGIRLIRGIWQRRKFISDLQTLCAGRGWEAGEPGKPCTGVITHPSGKTMCVTAGGKVSCVKLVTIADGAAAAVFTDDGKYTVTHRAGIGKVTFFSFVSEYRYGFDTGILPVTSEGKYRHVILVPEHPAAYIYDQGTRLPVDNGSVIGAYRLWSAAAFLNALERGVIDRV